jgi:hypothetical protein
VEVDAVACDVNIGMCADGSQARSEMEKTEKSTRKFSSGAMNAFKQIAGAATIAGAAYLAFKKFTDFVKGSIRAYAEYEEQLVKLNTVVRSTGGAAGFTTPQLAKMADEMQNLTTFSNGAVMEAQGVLLTFTQIGHDVFPEALKAATNMSTLFGGDLQQSTIQLGKALNDPVKGIGALSKVGVSFTEVQKEMIRGFIEQNDLASAQAVILKELNVEFGGQAEAVRGTLKGAWGALKNNFSDIQRAVGGAIAGAGGEGGLAAFVNKLNEFLQQEGTIRNIVRVFQSLGLVIATGFRVAVFSIKLFINEMRLMFAAAQDVGKVFQVLFDPANWKRGFKGVGEALRGIEFRVKEVAGDIKDDVLQLAEQTAAGFMKIVSQEIPAPKIPDLVDNLNKIPPAANSAATSIEAIRAPIAGAGTAMLGYSQVLALAYGQTVAVVEQTGLLTQAMTFAGITAEQAGSVFKDSWAASLEAAFATTQSFGQSMKTLMKELFASLFFALGKQLAVASGGYFLALQFGKGVAAAGLAALAFAAGAAIKSLQLGGMVPGGYGGGDRVPIMVEPGEMVLAKETVRQNAPAIAAMQGGESGGMFHVIVNVGAKTLYDDITYAIRGGNIVVEARDVAGLA